MAVDSSRKEEFLVLDGGVATELTRAGFNLDVSQSHNVYFYSGLLRPSKRGAMLLVASFRVPVVSFCIFSHVKKEKSEKP